MSLRDSSKNGQIELKSRVSATPYDQGTTVAGNLFLRQPEANYADLLKKLLKNAPSNI
jgi:hypothetical protein